MRKLSKLIAVVAAMALLMGMSTSAFAATINGSMTDPIPAAVTDPNGGPGMAGQVVGTDLPDPISDAEAEELVRDAGFTLNSNEKIVIVGSADLTFQKDGALVDVTGKNVTFTMDVPNGTEGMIVYVLHEITPGNWEIIECEVDANGQITVTLEGLSPVYLAMLQQKADQGNTDNTANTGKSPKTGF